MIESKLVEILRDKIPELSWSESFRTEDDNTGTVYDEGGPRPSLYDERMLYPQYMIYIRSSNFGMAKNSAQIVFDTLHKMENVVMEVPKYDNSDNIIGYDMYQVFLIEALSTPLRIGVQDDVMEYSVNIQATLRKL